MAITLRGNAAACTLYSSKREICPVCDDDVPPFTIHSCVTVDGQPKRVTNVPRPFPEHARPVPVKRRGRRA